MKPFTFRNALALLLLLALSAHAEKADRDKPMTIDATSVTADNNKKEALYIGPVIATQGTTKITASQLLVKEMPDGSSDLTFISQANKPVTYREKRDGLNEWIEAEAEKAIYYGAKESLDLIGNARIKRDKDDMRAPFITYNTKTGLFEARGSATPAATATDALVPPSNRVHMVIQPKTKSSPNSDTPAPAKATP